MHHILNDLVLLSIWSIVIDMETADNTAKPADDLDGQSTPSPRKSTPKQVFEDIEKIFNLRKRQHHERVTMMKKVQ